jgi:Icc-related predicted phosphoesterase
MFSRDEIPQNDRLSGSIVAVVRDVSPSRNDKLDYEVTVEDADGHSTPLKIWSTHGLTTSLEEGHRYELDDVRGRYWSQDGTRRYQLDSTRDFTATDLGSAADTATRLLLVGDTHVGYRHRHQDDKVAGAGDLDARESFRSVLEQADTLSVDAIVHAGDIFDHGATGHDRTFVIEQITENLDIPFYYVYGNHDEQASRRTVDGDTSDIPRVHRLSADTWPVRFADVALFGIDNKNSAFPGEPLEQSIDSINSSANVLAVHDTPYPVRDEQGVLLHNEGEADFRDAVEQSDTQIDLIVSGHMHVGQKGILDDFEIPVIVTGAPAPINKGKRSNNSSTWLLRVTEGGIEDITRQPL